jgi:hypothetical protein
MSKNYFRTAVKASAGLFGLLIFSHSSYASLALQEWNMTTRMGLPLYLKAWLAGMLLTHLLSICFVKRHNAARWVLGCFIVSHILVFGIEHSASTVLYGGMVSLSHVVFWIPALMALYRYKHEMSQSLPYRIWASAILFFYSISLLFDVRDSFTWLSHAL